MDFKRRISAFFGVETGRLVILQFWWEIFLGFFGRWGEAVAELGVRGVGRAALGGKARCCSRGDKGKGWFLEGAAEFSGVIELNSPSWRLGVKGG